jgi:serine/threonine protein kinase
MSNTKETLKSFSPNELVLNQYLIIKEIGRGGMSSIIYLAEDQKNDTKGYFDDKNKKVVVKVTTKTAEYNQSE